MPAERGGAAGQQSLRQQPVGAGLGDAGFFICLNVPKGFVSEVPHCSRDLELTEQRLHSFRWDKTQSWVVRRVSFSGEEKQQPQCVSREVEGRGGGGRVGEGAPEKAAALPCGISSPVPGASLPLGHTRDPPLPVVALTERTFVKRVSFNFACTKLILHILCTSLTVPIEPGPCGSAEGGGHDSDPPPPRRGRRKRREGGAGSREREARRRCRARTPTPAPQAGRASRVGSASPRAGPGLQPRSPRPAARAAAATRGRSGRARWCWVPLSAPLFCGLTFLSTACCSFNFCWCSVCFFGFGFS